MATLVPIENLNDAYNSFKDDFIAPGGAGCPGCGAVLATRIMMKILGPNTWSVMTTGCMAVNYTAPNTGNARSPWIHPLFSNSASIAAGLSIALKRRKLTDINLLVVAGDGATADIGFQTVSSAFQRGHKFIYLCYNNSGYMNTGNQSSGTSEIGTITKSTPKGNLIPPKNLPMIFRELGVNYIATANISYPIDFINKIIKAQNHSGPSYIEIFTPCVPGWGINSSDTILIGELAVKSGFQILFEVIKKKVFLSKASEPYLNMENRIDLKEFLELQERYKHLLKNKEQMKLLKAYIDSQWKSIVKELLKE